MIALATRVALLASLAALGACTAESGAPDITRGSADSPMTMLVDQTVNGVPTASGTQVMTGASAQSLDPAYRGYRTNVGGMMQPIPPQGGERY